MHLKTILFIILILAFSACNNSSKTKVETKTVNVAELLNIIDQNIDKEIYVTGTVNHVCSHSGRRAFLIDETGEYSIRIEAAGEIENFGKDLIGATLKVKCILKEERMTPQEIDEWEAEIIEKHPEQAAAEGEHCSAEMSNVKSMRQWMKDNNKDYYAIYYAEGVSYEVVE